MTTAWQFYFITLLTYSGVNIIAAWALNLQYGLGGILNFAFIIFQAVGAYAAAVLTLGPAGGITTFQTYVGGAHLPWLLALVVATLAGGVLALLVGLVALRPKRTDYQGMVLLTVAIIAAVVVTDEKGWLNGASGLVGVPKPFNESLGLGLIEYGWFYVGVVAVAVVLVFIVIHLLTSSPWCRQVRAMREDPVAAEALGLNVPARRLQVFVIGGAIAAFSGALLVGYIGSWSPGAWGPGETFLLFVCIVVGGLGNNFGAAVGSVLVLTVLFNGLAYLPIFSYTTAAEALQLVLLGLIVIAFLWFKPRGLFPERRRRFAFPSAGPDRGTAVAVEEAR
ncbi:MAG: branched-chain amino acid ABC transporter permease [Actinobacteria bacterium]|nr:branched-chain amino acid ABC transporter permease [Actinomycetota bacterium]